MRELGRWCFRHRRVVVCAWLVALGVVVGVAQAAGSSYNQSLDLPGTDSQAALNLLTKSFPAASGESDQIVIRTTGGATVRSAEVRTAVSAALGRVAGLSGVESVASPYEKTGAGQISRDGTIAFATVTWARVSADVTTPEAKKLIGAAESADGSHVHISLGGQAIQKQEGTAVGLSVIVGVFAAFVVLLIVFGGALTASVMPLLTAGLALIIGISFIGLLSHVMEVPSVATSLAILIGLGVGIDYGLFVISRHRSGVKAGMSYEDAAVQALNTSGRTVLFAGATVCIALLGQLALGVSFLNGMSIAAAGTVALMMAASLTFLPAMLGFLGPNALSRRERVALAKATSSDISPFWLRWASTVQARKALLALGALTAVVVIALPIFSLRLGNPDSGTDPVGSTTRQAYDALAKGFGPGFNGPLLLAAQTGTSSDAKAFDRLLISVGHLSGVASETRASPSPNGQALIATVYPATSPQVTQTVSLVNRLRDDLIPKAETGTGLRVHVGGQTATNIDFAHVLTDKLPIFIVIVVLLAFILLMAVFRSLLIPLVASLMNLLSIGAALGALNAVFNWGWGASILGLPGTGPITPFIPVLTFSVLFGLSMDYEVYLISRIQEQWRYLHHPSPPGTPANVPASQRNHEAVVIGQAESGRIIAGAASIMILVFGSFILGSSLAIKTFGFGLGFAVLIDAFIIRSVAVPAIMHLIGPANWAMPARLERILPNLSIETDDSVAPASCAASPPAHTAKAPTANANTLSSRCLLTPGTTDTSTGFTDEADPRGAPNGG